MSLFPKIEKPCPYKSEVADFLDGEHCKLCKRTVTNLGSMSEPERLDFLANCSDNSCVQYRVPLKQKFAAIAMGVAATGVAAPANATEQVQLEEEEYDIFIGGIKHSGKVELEGIKDGKSDLPVIYEDEPEKTQKPE